MSATIRKGASVNQSVTADPYARDAAGNIIGLARVGTPLPLLRSAKAKSVIGTSGLRPGSIGAGSANASWHTRTRARGPFYAVEVGVASVSGALTAYDHIAVGATSTMGTGSGLWTPDQGWNLGPAVTVPATGTADSPAFATTGPIFCRSVPPDDGKDFPFLDVRIHTAAGLPAYSNVSGLATTWNTANPLWPMKCYSQGGDFVSTNQGGFNPGSANTILVPAFLRVWYDRPGYTVLVVGDSTAGADSVLDGSAARNGYAFRAVRALQDMGLPFDVINGAWSGNSFTGYNSTMPFTNRAKAMIDAVKPDVVIMPVYTPNDQCDTQAGIDKQWFFANVIAEYAKSANAIPLMMTPFPNNSLNLTMDNLRKQNRDRAIASGHACLNVDPLVATGSPARWITGMNDNGDNVHPGAMGHATVANSLVSKVLELFY